ncbi:MAG: ASKHA domain-containing protein [Rhodospirillaceae bacterium]
MADTVAVTFVDPDDPAKLRSARVARGKTLLDAGHAAGVDIEATCGARGRCRTCRVKILSGEVPPATLQDTVQLGHEEVRENFRLACQTKAIADTRVMALPPKAEKGHQILSSGKSVADDGRLTLDSGVAKYVVKASTPTEEHHQTSDWEETLSVLPDDVSRDATLEVLRKVPGAIRAQGGTMTVTVFNGRIIDVEPGDTSEHRYGLAFDIGTTSIVGTLIDLETGETLADVGGVNPQAVYGGDLMSRIAYAQFDEKKLATLRARALNAINDFIAEACEEAGIDAAHIYKIVVVGNTCMHHILLGVDVTYVGLAPYAPVICDPMVVAARDMPLKRAVNAQVCFLPIVAGFVGADTMACVLATRIYDSDEIRTLVDIGTNGEVVMGSKRGLMVCSAPAGPALEGAQIRHGMRGALGAIEKVAIDDDVACAVIGATPAVGICGSGLIDACAKLADARVLETSGRLLRKNREQLPDALRARLVDTPDGCEFVLVGADESGKDEPITLTQADIRQVQLAKSAIYSGIVMLQRVMDVADEDLEEVMMCGGFGNYINIESAVKIRLIPNLPLQKITYSGNAALMGAQMALLSETERDRAAELAQRMEHVALAARPEFQDIFVEAMSFLGPDTPVGASVDVAPKEAAVGGD